MTHFVNKGDLPLTPVQLERRAQKHIKRVWSDQAREKSIRLADGAFDAFMLTFSADHNENVANNTFNWQLQEYGTAVARLDKYRLADGRPEYTVETPTGTYDDEGNEIMDVTTVPAIEPLDVTVEQLVYADDPMVEPTLETVPNPLIVQDDAEREAAQAVVDATPEDVRLYSAN